MGLFNFGKPKSELEIMMEEAKKIKNQNKTDVLYQLEHLNLRQLFFDLGPSFIDSLLNKDGFIYFTYSKQCELMKQAPKYKKEDFKLSARYNEKHNVVFRLIPPEPYRAPLCYKIFMIVDQNGQPVEYKTLEKSIGNQPPVLCGWDKGGNHYSYSSSNANDEYCGLAKYDLDLSAASSFADLLNQSRKTDSNEYSMGISFKEEEPGVYTKETTIEELRKRISPAVFNHEYSQCKKCGAYFYCNEKFCSKCGTKL